MQRYEQNESRQTKKGKYQSSSVRIKKPLSLNFEFKSSLFTEKNKTLIEKLVSRNVSQETSFSKEEINDKDKEKEMIKPKTKKAFSTIKAKIPISLNTSLVENKNKANIKKTQNKLDTKSILPNKKNSSLIVKNKDTKPSLTNCQIKPIHKKIISIAKKPIPNPKTKVPNQTVKNSLDKKIVFNGITHDLLNKNKTRNNPAHQKPRQNSNLNTTIKVTFMRKKFGENVHGQEKNKNIKNKNLRNSVDNKNNNINLITVNTIYVKDRIKSIGGNNNLKAKNKKKINNNDIYTSPENRRTIQHK